MDNHVNDVDNDFIPEVIVIEIVETTRSMPTLCNCVILEWWFVILRSNGGDSWKQATLIKNGHCKLEE
ncbi:hypothetical protein HN51_025724 [Arachis hypogaea]